MEEYRRLGLEPGGPEPADHLSVELEYLAALVSREAAAWEAGAEGVVEIRAQERRFLQTHPGRWVPELVACIRQHHPEGVYAAAAEALESFVQHEADLTAVLLRDPEKAGLGR